MDAGFCANMRFAALCLSAWMAERGEMSTATNALNPRDIEMFRTIGVSPELLEAAHIERVSDGDARERFGLKGPLSQDMSGIAFPYYSSATGRRVTARVRRDNPELEDGKPKAKYIAAWGDSRHLYFPPNAWALLQAPDTPVVLVEAEKSVLALTAWAERTGTNMLAVGLGGCWGWRGRIGKTENEKGARVDVTGAISDLSVCDGRTVFVLLDANAATNPKVQQARAALCKELSGRCTVKVCTLPILEGVNGPDDYIGVSGDAAMSTVIADATEPDGELPEYSDDSLALKFTEKYGDTLRYTAQWGHWSQWTGSVWKQDETLAIFNLARKICREASATCVDARVAGRISSAMTVAAVERLARADRSHSAVSDQWDADPWMLNTPGGIVDLRTGKLLPSDRLAYCTKQTAVQPGGDCSLWLDFLHRITNHNRELQDFMQRMVGYALTGITREHALFFLYGTGANGKSVFLNTISGLMGGYSTTAPIETFIDSKSERHPTDLAGLRGARLVSATETEDGRRWAESKLKALTGGDRIAARFMRQDFFEFSPVFKLIIAGNHKPGLRTVDEAMRRRFNLLPFTTTIPASERDLQLADKLRAEWGGILAWAVEGCLSWQANGLQAPATVTEATADYLGAEDTLQRWIEDRCRIDKTARETSTALFSNWKGWAEENGEFVGSQKRFAQNLESRGFNPLRTRSSRGFLGIGLVTLATDAPHIPVTRGRAGAQRTYTEDVSQVSPESNEGGYRV
jgi:putative DNA primase/helicase